MTKSNMFLGRIKGEHIIVLPFPHDLIHMNSELINRFHMLRPDTEASNQIAVPKFSISHAAKYKLYDVSKYKGYYNYSGGEKGFDLSNDHSDEYVYEQASIPSGYYYLFKQLEIEL